MKNIIPLMRIATAGRGFLFILALFFTVNDACPVMADTICMDFFKACHDVTILSEAKDTVRVQLRDGHVMDVPRRRIQLLLKPAMKVYVYRNDWTGSIAWFRSSNDSGYTFAARSDGTGEFTVKSGDIYFISGKLPGEAGQDKTAYARHWPELDAWSLLFAAGFLQGILLALMLFRKKSGSRRANRALALIILNGSVTISGGFTTAFINDYTYFCAGNDLIGTSAVFLFGPLLYLYVIVITRPGFRLRPLHCLHLVPACAACIYLLCDMVMMNSEELGILFSYTSLFLLPSITSKIISTAFGIHPILYIIISIRFMAAHRRRIQDVFSSTEKLNLTWLTFILRFMLGAGVLWFAYFLTSRIILFLNFDHHYILLAEVLGNSITLAGVILVILFYAIGYRGLMQPEIFAGIPDDVIEQIEDPDQKVSISPEKTREIMDRVTKVMDEERPYLDPGLTLPMLADMAGVSRNLLSQAINEHTRQNFYDFVNFYRVETVKEYLKDPGKRDMNVLHIAFDAGFNTKATFNAVFKKSTGLTPSQYRKSFEAAEGAPPATPMTLQ